MVAACHVPSPPILRHLKRLRLSAASKATRHEKVEIQIVLRHFISKPLRDQIEIESSIDDMVIEREIPARYVLDSGVRLDLPVRLADRGGGFEQILR